ncbi:C39 family peptidase [Candidatus Berkelbacteria bacterium]|nr:C39 family peptidase [Candidatus Berkelbacteria bacterium]
MTLRPTLPADVLGVPTTYRTRPDYCGPAVIRALLRYWTGQELDEAAIAHELQTTHEAGTPPEALVTLLAHRGFQVELRQQCSLEDLRIALGHGRTVVIDFQAWPETDHPADQPSSGDDGHYVILIGIDECYLYLMDPSLEHGYGYVAIEDFEPRWYDVNAIKRYDRAAIFVEGQTPHPVAITGNEPLTVIP